MLRRILKLLRNILLLLLLIFGFPGAIVMVADFSCHSSISTWLPTYPNAEEKSVQYNFIRPHGLGSTLRILETPDSIEQVEAFYYDNIQALVNDGVPRGMGTTDFSVEENPDGDGSLIILFSRCIVS